MFRQPEVKSTSENGYFSNKYSAAMVSMLSYRLPFEVCILYLGLFSVGYTGPKAGN